MAVALSRTDDQLTRRQLRRAVWASTIGTSVEWYDVVLYGLLVPLYIGRLFFPSHDPLTSVLAGNVALLFSFAARPVGGAIFGRLGDRVGRKATLITTLVIAGVASALVGALPTFAQVGVLAPLMLFVLRVFIGAALGGEWGGAVLLTLEWGNRSGRRGLWSSFPQTGAVAATVLGLLAIQASTALVGASSPLAWRLPFLASILLVVIGLYVRLGVLETPTFSRLLEERRLERRPVLTVLRRQWREVALTALLRMGEQAPLVLFTTFFLVYTRAIGVPPARAIAIAIASGVVGAAATPFFGHLSDRLGRRLVFGLGAAAMLALAFPYFALLAGGDTGRMLLAAVLGQVVVAAMAGPEGALIAESFTGRLRYSGASIGAGLGAPLAGGAASILGVLLFQHYQSTLPVALYMAGCAAVSIVAVTLLRERSHADLNTEYEGMTPETGRSPAPASA